MNARGQDQKPAVSVVIPTYNQAALLKRCLDSLAAQDFTNYEVLVVDDASTEEAIQHLPHDYPFVQLIHLQNNRGFAVAVNAGLRQARGEWVLLLNNDVRLAPDFLDRMLARAEATGAAMIAPLLLWEDNPEVVYSMGDRITPGGRPEALHFRTPLADAAPSEFIFGATAAASLFHHAIFTRVGLLDESFIAYFEDADLCYRARLAGFDAALAIEARAWHVGSASISGKTWWRSAQCYRNHALLVIKNTPWPLLIRFALPVLRERLHQTRRLLSSARTEFGLLHALRLLALNHAMIWRRLPGALRARWRIQRTRRISLAALRRLLEGTAP